MELIDGLQAHVAVGYPQPSCSYRQSGLRGIVVCPPTATDSELLSFHVLNHKDIAAPATARRHSYTGPDGVCLVSWQKNSIGIWQWIDTAWALALFRCQEAGVVVPPLR